MRSSDLHVTGNMKKCEWKKVTRKSLSLSEWQCLKCGRTGYASHEKPPVNCLKPSFGINVNSSRSKSPKWIGKITETKVGGYSLSFLIVACFVVILAAFSQFKCDIYALIDFDSAVCASVSAVDDVYESEAADGLKDTLATTQVYDGVEYVDYADVEKYIDMLQSEIVFLDNAIDGSPLKYQQNYTKFYDMSETSRAYFIAKIEKCFGGDRGNELALEVTRLQNFVSDKADRLYDLAYK